MASQASYPSSDQESCSSATDYSQDATYPQSDECVADDTVAIVGMGCRWPGGVSTPSQLWDLLAHGKSGYRDFDKDKLNISGFYHPDPQRPGSTPARGAYQLQEDPKLFDHAFFGITPTETLTLDPQHRKLLEVVYEAFESAGEPWEKFSGSRTGVFVGNFTADSNLMSMRDMDNVLPYATTGGSTSILSNRINYVFNLRGPSLTLDTACSSSLYALHLAVNAIKNGDCDSAVVGAGNLILSPELHLSLSKLGALSPSATCHVFDAAADGYARGEGFAAFYLKRTSDAVAGAYPIRSVIRGTAINSNGRTAGITHPSAEGQVEVIRQAYATAKLSPSMTGYFEAHGTGTQVGDPTEVSAIGQIFSPYSEKSELRIGSIKSNIGHTEAASGMAGLMKAILAMENDCIPPTIGISQLNPRINFQEARVRPVTRLEAWPSDRLKRSSINSFGYGGANGHCILDHVSVALPSYKKSDTQRSSLRSRRMVILPFSAKEEKALRQCLNDISSVLTKRDIADLAYTLSVRRSRFNHRTYRIIESGASGPRLDPRTTTPIKPVGGRVPNIGLIFTGQGAQWEGMGADLLEYAVFRNTIAYQDSILSILSNKPSWSIHDIIQGKSTRKLHEPLISQTVCTAIQVALVDLLRSWSIEWTGSVGHSSGEIAAAYAAGLLTSREAIVVAYCRGLAVASNKRSGMMLAVGLGKDEIEPYLENFRFNVRVAATNSPESVTLSGDTVSVMEVYENLLVKGVFAKLLQTGRNAYHSHHMVSIGEEYVTLLEKALTELLNIKHDFPSQRLRRAEWFSSATPEKTSRGTSPDPMYWRWNLQAPVQFSSAVENLSTSPEADVDVLIEIGPHSALKSPLRQILSQIGEEFCYLPTLRRREDGIRNMLDLAGGLFCMNAQVDLSIVNAADELDANGKSLGYSQGSLCVDLPRQAYNYGPILYHENRLSKENRLREHLKHDILGSKQLGVSRYRPSWRNLLRLKDVPWLSHHKLAPQIVFPASAYICMAIEAADQFFQGQSGSNQAVGFTIRNLSLKAALVIPDADSGVEMILDLDASRAAQLNDGATWYTFRISSVTADTNSWTEHCSGIIRPNIQRLAQSFLSDAMDRRSIRVSKWYKSFAEVGLDYGETFRGLSNLTSDPLLNIAQAKVALNTTSALFDSPESQYLVHPASLDMCAQLALIAAHGGQVEQMSTAYVPSFVGEMTIWASTAESSFGTATAKGRRCGLRGANAQVQLVDDCGRVMLDLNDVRCTAYAGTQATDARAKVPGSPYMRLAWKPDLDIISRDQARALFPPTETTGGMENTFADIDRLGALMVAEITERFGSRSNDADLPAHFQKFLAWAGKMASLNSSSTNDVAEHTSVERVRAIDALCAKLQDIVEIPLSKRIFDNLGDIFMGTKSSLELVRQDDSHSQMYNSGLGISAAYAQLERIVDLLAHANPSMKILEIGAGTGGATRVAVKTLNGRTHSRRYGSYTFTDVSSGYFFETRKEFSDCHQLDFAVLDIEQSPFSQGFEAVYDLVIASCSIHVTRDINLTLSNARSLLKPGGKFLILECTQPKVTHGLVLGTLPDYWVGTEEARMDSPFLPVEEWQNMLGKAGFSGIDIELDDYAQPYTMISTLLSSAVEAESLLSTPKVLPATGQADVQVLSVCGKRLTSYIDSLRAGPLGGSTYFWPQKVEALAEHDRVIILHDGGWPITTEDMQFQELKIILSKARSILWVNIMEEEVEIIPHAGVSTGLLRVMASENPSLAFTSIDIGKRDLIDMMQRIIALERTLQGGDIVSVNTEFRVSDGIFNISRLIPDEELNERSLQSMKVETELLPIGDQPPLAANFEKPGILGSVYFEEDPMSWMPLRDDELEVRTLAVGLNWKDLAVCAGRLDLNNFSSECAGVVTRIGEAVNGFRVGDRVFGLSKGKFGNYMRCNSSLVQPMRSDNFSDMATIPVVYMTAWYAFKHLARVQPGDKVLIQSASGGLGIAALNVARHLGAEIFVTVGTDDKRKFIQETYGIADAHIFSSRASPDLELIKDTTGHNGFDVVLSTVTGDSLNEWLRCLAPAGRFVDVGRVDVQDHATMAMEVFKRNATFSSFDLGILVEDKPKLCAKLLAEVSEMWHGGVLPPIALIRTFDVSQLGLALLYLSKGTHIGKVVITYQDPRSLICVSPRRSTAARFDPTAIYVLVGGLGGLGRSMISWMAERGARGIRILSRSPPSDSNSPFIAAMTSVGCKVEHVPCDVTRSTEVEAAIALASRSGTIRGVIHTAVMLQDKLFDTMSSAEWQRGLAVKVEGTVHLHRATLGLPLDFFVLISSNVAQVALPTQATYCASNNFQNEFARYRRRQGLPAIAVELGLIEEAGDLGQNPVYHKATMRNGLYHTSERELLGHLEHVFSNVNRHVTSSWLRYDPCADAHLVTSLDPARLLELTQSQQNTSSERASKPRWHSDARFSHIVRSMENLAASEQDVMADSTDSTPVGQSSQAAITEVDALVRAKDIKTATMMVTKSIMARMADMLFISSEGMDATKGVAAYGMDSLIAAELRNWFVSTYKCTISFLKLLDTATSIQELAEIVVKSRMKE